MSLQRESKDVYQVMMKIRAKFEVIQDNLAKQYQVIIGKPIHLDPSSGEQLKQLTELSSFWSPGVII